MAVTTRSAQLGTALDRRKQRFTTAKRIACRQACSSAEDSVFSGGAAVVLLLFKHY